MIDIKVGQQVFVVKKVYRHGQTPATEYQTVTKVGRKYFWIKEGHWEVKFDIETGMEAGTCNYKDRAYLNEEAYNAEVEREKTIRDITAEVRGWTWYRNVPTDKLKIIHQILKEHK